MTHAVRGGGGGSEGSPTPGDAELLSKTLGLILGPVGGPLFLRFGGWRGLPAGCQLCSICLFV